MLGVLGRSKAAGGSAAAAKPEATTTRPTNAASDIQVFDKSLCFPKLSTAALHILQLLDCKMNLRFRKNVTFAE